MERVQIATHITKLFVKTTILFLQCINGRELHSANSTVKSTVIQYITMALRLS